MKVMKRYLLPFFVFQFFQNIQVFAKAASGTGFLTAGKVVSLHTNDHHGAVLPDSGNIRVELSPFPIMREHILTLLSFENYLYAVSLKGSDKLCTSRRKARQAAPLRHHAGFLNNAAHYNPQY
jgi:2',3'-cyclic-nucleotide 2'-phosphodiesterase (5'-nucleotidase family)